MQRIMLLSGPTLLHMPARDLVTEIMSAAITISSHANGGEVDIFEYLAGVSRDRSRPIVVAESLAGSAGRAGRAALTHTHISYTHTASTRNHECTHFTCLLLFPLKTSDQ